MARVSALLRKPYNAPRFPSPELSASLGDIQWTFIVKSMHFRCTYLTNLEGTQKKHVQDIHRQLLPIKKLNKSQLTLKIIILEVIFCTLVQASGSYYYKDYSCCLYSWISIKHLTSTPYATTKSNRSFCL